MKKKPSNKKIEALREKLVRKPRLVWDVLGTQETQDAFAFSDAYKAFLDVAKTEREAAEVIINVAKRQRFKDITRNTTGRRFYKVIQKKGVALAVVGKDSLESGLNLVVSHIDAPRLDLKQNPLYEDVDLAFLKTHYYGGIKKYQWLARPLALHGTVLKQDGGALDIQVGEQDDDPVFTIADLLPHLSHKVQADKKVSEAFQGEKLNLLVGSLPLGNDDVNERFKLAVLNLLYRRYGLIEEDLVSAELEVVPAGRARDIGWDRGLVGAYGQDDRVCAYTALQAIGATTAPKRTAVALFLDKEEVGSDGSTGAKSRLLEDFVADLIAVTGGKSDRKTLRSCLSNSRALSADVNCALDPDYQEVHEKRNAAKIGYGVCITKFTGARGKYGSSDANAEYLGRIRKVLNDNNVVWQTGELGKVDEGGGGTIAKFLSVYGMEVLDCGTPILSMHSPFEIASKGDIYMTYQAYRGFFNS
jgi:aspartyl aminopeptidase